MDEAVVESDIVGPNLGYMKMFGLWTILNTYRVKKKRNWLLNATMVGTVVSITPYFVLQCISYFYVTVDIQKMALFVLNPLTCLQTLLKMSVFWYRIDDQNRFFGLMKKNFLGCTPKDRTTEAESILKTAAKNINLLCGAAIFVNGTCVMVWNLLPVVKYLVREEGSESVEPIPNKILAGWYPFDYLRSPGYEIVFAYEFAICSWSGVVVTLHELLLAQTVMMLYGQISILAFNLETLRVPKSGRTKDHRRHPVVPPEYRNNPGPIEFGTDEEIERQMYEQLLRCVKDHQRLMK